MQNISARLKAQVNGHILFKAGLEEYGEPPCYQYAPKDKPDFQAEHMPVFHLILSPSWIRPNIQSEAL